MNEKDRYIEELETLVHKELLPIYHRYYELIGEPIPKFDIPIFNYKNKLPALLRADFDVFREPPRGKKQ